MPRIITLTAPALLDPETGELTPLDEGVVFVRPGDCLAMEGGGDIPKRLLADVDWKRAELLPRKVHRIKRAKRKRK